jgi:hypothetical protein
MPKKKETIKIVLRNKTPFYPFKLTQLIAQTKKNPSLFLFVSEIIHQVPLSTPVNAGSPNFTRKQSA